MTHQDAYNVVLSVFLLFVAIGTPLSMVTASFDGRKNVKRTKRNSGKKAVRYGSKSRPKQRAKIPKKKKPRKIPQWEIDAADRYRIGRDYGHKSTVNDYQRMPL